MNTKTSTLLVIPIATIPSLSVTAIGEIPQVAADKNDIKIMTRKMASIRISRNSQKNQTLNPTIVL
jgi:hypothetical protein